MKKTKLIVCLSAVFSLFIIACSHYDQLQKNGKESKASGKSHNAGQDCMKCHNDNSNEASSEAWWYVAGTVYTASGSINTNARIEIWSEPEAKGYKITSLPADKNGNFYTEKILKFNNGSYPIAISGNDTTYMISAFNGQGCNSCHGLSTDKIYVN